MWTIRIIHEAQMSELHHGNCFVTLTYRDPDACTKQQYAEGYYIPANYSLNKKHFRDFIKRLRRKHKQKIRFYHCGEYGEETQRPHYHACLFNISFDDQKIYSDDEGIKTYTSESLQSLWPYGFTTVGELNYDTAAYTARYCLKKVTGKAAPDHYLRCDEYGEAYWLQPEYNTMSTGHTAPGGLGASWYEKYKKDVFPCDNVPVPGKGVIQKVPRYYQAILESQDPGTLEMVKKLRKIFITKHAADFTPERLMQKYQCHMAKQSTRRNTI